MTPTSAKRTAVNFPDTRPTKRQATSSPEEGELDDGTPPPLPSGLTTGSLTPPKAAGKAGSRVPFPFKKKASTSDTRPEYPPEVPQARGPPLVYNRSVEDERRFRDDDLRRGAHARPPRHDPRSARLGDHWVSNHYDDRAPRSRWESQDVRHDTERLYQIRGAVDRWPRDEVPQALVSPRPQRRSRSPSSPRSTGSPLSPESNSKEKHRLPRPSLLEQDSRSNFDYDRDRDWSGTRDSRDYKRDRRRSSPGAITRKGDSYIPNDDDDRHYRPRRDSRDTWRRREDDEDVRRYSDDRDDRGSRRGFDAYHPLSPHTPPRQFSPLSTHRVPVTPPLPSEAPPPPPPNDPSNALPTEHAMVKISLPKKPPTPIAHVPLSLIAVKEIPKSEPERVQIENEPIKEQAKVIVHRTRRKPVQRTREEEKALYGRIFRGCGMQSDYDVINKLGEGTFGEVHKAIHRVKGHPVALKRILMHNEKEGMPVTALREIKILKSMRHPCIVDILDMFVVRSNGKQSPLSVYMVFPYMDHDLAGLLENERVKLSPSQIKLYMKQLLEGTEYMHRNHILHRDMKAANLLISNTGALKIADFGLARAFDPNIVRGGDVKDAHPGKERKYTNCVVTRWYRPPELLLGARQYGGEVDMWGIGCVLGEMFWRRPILPGSSDLDQLDKIWQLCGTPTQITWPNHDTLPGCEGVKRFNMYPRRLKQTYETIGPETCDLLDKLLSCNPRERITASQALDHDYFWTDPLPADPSSLPSYEASHEFDKRGRRNQAPVGPPVVNRPDVPSRLLPVPTQPPLHFNGRPPPPRESFRGSHGGPAPYPPFPPPQQRFPAAPSSLPPYSLRPGQPPPAIWQPPPDRPAHLPPRPAFITGREDRSGGRHQWQNGHGGSELNYG